MPPAPHARVQNLTPAAAAQLGEAFRLLQSGAREAAEAIVARVIEAFPSAVDALHLFALCRKAAGDREAAAHYFERALSLTPKHPQILNNYANLLSDMGRVEEALDRYRQAIASAPDFADGWLNLGLALNRLKRHGEAVETLERAARLSPQRAAIHNALGIALKELGRLEEAVAAYARALAIDPNHRKARHNMGVALNGLDRHEEALASFEAVIRQGETSAEAQYNHACTLFYLERFDDAVVVFERLLAANPGYLSAHESYNRMLWEYGQHDRYGQSYRHAQQLMPGNAGLRLGEAMALHRAGQNALAGERLEALRKDIGPEVNVMASLGLVYNALERYPEARHAYESAIKSSPPNAGLHTAFANHLLCAHQPEAARQQAEIALQLAPHDQAGWAYLGLAWRLMGDARDIWLNDYGRFVNPIEIETPKGFADLAAFNAALAEALIPLHHTKFHPAEQTLRGGTQTVGSLFAKRHPLVQMVRAQIDAAVRQVIARLPDDPSHPFLGRKTANIRFSGSWSVRLAGQGYHVSHIHPQGWISSAYYVELPGAVNKNDDRQGWIQFGVPPVEMRLDLAPGRVVKPQVGTLVLFPSYMWHGTIPFEDVQPRMTIAFDVVPI